MVSVNWKYPLVVGIVTAVIAASMQVVSVLLQEIPGINPLGDYHATDFVFLLVLFASIFLSYSYFLHSATHRHGLDLILLVVGLVLTTLLVLFENVLIDVFFPKTLISGYFLFDCVGVAFAGYMLLLYNWGEQRRQQKLARQQEPAEAAQSSL